MKKELNWTELLEDMLTDEDMNKIRGGDGSVEDPNGPIIK
jgi:hypothetical protein